jgi:hypothetical protein
MEQQLMPASARCLTCDRLPSQATPEQGEQARRRIAAKLDRLHESQVLVNAIRAARAAGPDGETDTPPSVASAIQAARATLRHRLRPCPACGQPGYIPSHRSTGAAV